MGSLPDQVQRQADRANEIHKQVYSPETDPDTQDPANVDPPEPVEDLEPLEQPNATPKPEPVAPADPAPTTSTAAPADPEDSWEQRYRTAQGMMKAEAQRHATERQDMQKQIDALKEQVNKVTAPPAEPAPPAPKSLVTEADLETYGPELLDVIGRKAQEMAADIVEKRMAELKPELDQTKERVETFAAQAYKTNEDKFYGELAKAVPDWQTVNADQQWLAWLGEVDPLSGVPRQRYLDNAAQQLDHARTAALFQAFKDSTGKGAAPESAPASAPARHDISPTPRTVGNASAPTPREPQAATVSRQEIDAHYKRSAHDASYRSSDEYKAMDQRIASAMSTGQIT